MNFEAVLMTFHNESDECIAKKSLNKANAILESIKKNDEKFNIDEKVVREMLELYLTAFWGLPDMRDILSEHMHNIGKELRSQNLCELKFDKKEGKYYSACPCKLLHNDCGFSLRGTEKYKCSICGKQTIECEHITGCCYDNIICVKDEDDICNICTEKNCEHISGNYYNDVLAIEIVYDLNVITFDMVRNPKMAYARIGKIYYDKDYIYSQTKHIPEFVYGMALNCDHCIICEGYDKNIWKKAFESHK